MPLQLLCHFFLRDLQINAKIIIFIMRKHKNIFVSLFYYFKNENQPIFDIGVDVQDSDS